MLYVSYSGLIGVFFSVIYISVTFLSFETSFYHLLFGSLISLILVFLLLPSLVNDKKTNNKLPSLFYVYLLVIISVITLKVISEPQSFKYDAHFASYYIFSFVCFSYLYIARVPLFRVLSFVNSVFFTYIAVCITFWLLEVNTLTYEVSAKHALDVFGIDKSVLLGLDGSPASIDSFSALVFLLNFFFNIGKKRRLILFCSFVITLLTLRLTPLVAMSITLIVYQVIVHRYIWGFVFISMLSVMVVSCVGAYFIMHNTEPGLSEFYLPLYKATHARMAIWGLQIAVMLENYHWWNFFLGGFQNELFTVPLYQQNGEQLSRQTFNSHNSLLLLFFRNPFLFCLAVAACVYLSIKNYKRKNASIIFFIFLCLMMNSSLLASGNLIFTFVLIYMLLPEKNLQILASQRTNGFLEDEDVKHTDYSVRTR